MQTLHVRTSALASLAETLTASAKEHLTEVQTLQEASELMLQNWQGDGAEAYRAEATRQITEQKRQVKRLIRAAALAGEIAGTYEEADVLLARLFGDV